MRKNLANTRLIKVAANDLQIHPLAQRQIIPSHLKRIKDNLNLDAISVLHACEYEIDGVRAKWIVDGQHRWQALIDHGFGEWEVDVELHVDAKDHRAAAQLFLDLNNKKTVGTFENFEKQLMACHPIAVGVDRVARECALRIAHSAGAGKICCVTSAQSIYRIDEGATLFRSLKTLIAAYGRTAEAVEGKLVDGMAIIFKTYNGVVDEASLVKKLAKYPGGASGLIGAGKGLRQFKKVSLARCIAEVLVEAYNSGRATGRLEAL